MADHEDGNEDDDEEKKIATKQENQTHRLAFHAEQLRRSTSMESYAP